MRGARQLGLLWWLGQLENAQYYHKLLSVVTQVVAFHVLTNLSEFGSQSFHHCRRKAAQLPLELCVWSSATWVLLTWSTMLSEYNLIVKALCLEFLAIPLYSTFQLIISRESSTERMNCFSRWMCLWKVIWRLISVGLFSPSFTVQLGVNGHKLHIWLTIQRLSYSDVHTSYKQNC